MNIFEQFAAQMTTPSLEADVNINIDVNEGARPMAPVDTSTVVESPAIEPAVDPLEGTSPIEPAVDPTATDVNEAVASEEVPAEEPGAAIDGAAQAEADAEPEVAEETPATEEVPAEETVVEETTAEEATDEEVEDALEDDAEEAEEKAEVVEDVKSSLESVYETLASMESAGIEFDGGHAALTAIALNTTMGRIGGTAGSIAPSLESDNYFERTDLVASMEGIGAAIGAAAKAGLDAIIKAIRTAIAYLKKKFSKLGSIKSRFTAARAISKKMPADKKVTVKYTAPGEDMTVFTALEQWDKYVKAIETSGRDINKLHAYIKSNPIKASEGSVSVSQAGARELERMFSLAESMVDRIQRTDIVKQLEALEKAYAALSADLDKTPTKMDMGAAEVAEIRVAVGAIISFLDSFKVDAPAA